ncbi:TRAP transporter substrate-binding protein [Mailhella massiliensis]|uniref:TRAP transporter substrate-binding protein n=1 Tax=Mailhella massiliensis TaxID=1903261 RepID=UPI00235468F6|nr:TRAP transporter substrate-binding protein [Mailhella massiliensis]
MLCFARHAVALATVALFGFTGQALAAEPVTLKFATQNTENAWTTVNGIKPWLEKIEKDANGSIKFDFYANQTLTKGNQAWQAVRKGIADMSWVTMGSYPGMNLLMEIINQPGMGFETAMEAVDRLYAITDKVPAAAKPFASNKVIAMFSGDPGTGVLMSKTPIRTLEDLKGKKIRCAAGAYLDMLKALGASPVVMPMPDCYMALQKGTIDGILGDIDSYLSYRFYEVARYATNNIPRGCTLFLIIMNDRKYASLSDDAKKAIDAHAGIPGSKELAETFSYNQRSLFKEAEAQGAEVIRLSDEEKARWTELLKPLWDEWIQTCADKGFEKEAPVVLRMMQGK